MTSFVPSLLMAEQHMTGQMSPEAMPFIRPVLNSSSVNSSPSKYFSMSASSVSAMTSFRASLSSSVTTEGPNLSFRAWMTSSRLTFSLSVLLMTKNLGTLNFWQEAQAFSVPTWMPEDASTKMAAASAAFRAELTSPTKSNTPGVSRKLILVLLYSTGTMDREME